MLLLQEKSSTSLSPLIPIQSKLPAPFNTYASGVKYDWVVSWTKPDGTWTALKLYARTPETAYEVAASIGWSPIKWWQLVRRTSIHEYVGCTECHHVLQ